MISDREIHDSSRIELSEKNSANTFALSDVKD